MSEPTNIDALQIIRRKHAEAVDGLKDAQRELEGAKAKVLCFQERVKLLGELLATLQPTVGFHPSFPGLGRYHSMMLSEAVLDLVTRTDRPFTIAEARRELLDNGLQTPAKNFVIALHQVIGRLAAKGKVIVGQNETGEKIFRVAPQKLSAA
jgi:hypothetical protein